MSQLYNLSQLDALQVGAPVLGDEQVLDVELDRHTVFLPTAKPTHGSDPWDLDDASTRFRAEPAPALPGAFLSYLLWL
jgi:hypothetical protein